MKLTQNTILITGGTSGIGRALAKQFLDLDNTVIVTGRSEERLASVTRELPRVRGIIADQTDPSAIVRLHAQVLAEHPELNVLINNAGIGLKRNLHDTAVALSELETEIRANLTGPIQMVAQFLDHLKSRPSSTIINVTSGLAFVPLPLKPIYCATKAAMHSYTQSLRVQLRRTSVDVVELAPPAVATDFNKGQEDMNKGPRMDADTFARAALKGLEEGRKEILPGLSSKLRLISRIKPNATLRSADAERLAD